MADFRLDRIKFRWVGVWNGSPDTTYIKDDVVMFDGKTYVCLIGHTPTGYFYDDLTPVVPSYEISLPRWELMFDGQRWLGEWSTGTQYVEGNIVTYKAYVYRCIIPHASPINPNLGIQADILKWEVIAKGSNWTNIWEPNVYYDLGDVITYNGYVYICNTRHRSATSVSLGLEIDQLKWTLVNTSQTWQGDWTGGTRYRYADIVRYGGKMYQCIDGHTSASVSVTLTALSFTVSAGIATLTYAAQSLAPYAIGSTVTLAGFDPTTTASPVNIVNTTFTVVTCTSTQITFELTGVYASLVFGTVTGTSQLGLEDDSLKWTTYLSGIEYKHDWEITVRYKINDIVKYGPTLWRCISSHTSGILFTSNSAAWEVWLPGLTYDRGWNANTPYKKGDIVLYGGYAWTALTNTTGSIPSLNNLLQDTGNWELLKQGYVHQGEWLPSAQYYPGDVVRVRGYLYIALVDTSLNHPNDSADWQLIVPGSNWKAEWDETSDYFLGDIVVYASTSYSCIQRHSGAALNSRPDLDIINAYWIVLFQGAPTNVLTNRGDLKYFDTATTRLPIGTTGFTLQVNETVKPEWANFQLVEKVYYVATSGVDNADSGTTLNSPFRTVRFACNFILEDEANRAPATIFIKSGIYEEIIPISVPANVALVGDELRTSTIMPATGYELNNMFLVRNASGIRNMTLQGLNGTLGAPNEFGTRRPTAGAYVSLDPGNGNTDEDVWITTRSPYVQNVTTFGTGCVGMKIDGSLHNGGNKSIVANDFTQVLSDGIGYWASFNGLSELVSVFTYFCHIGYLSTDGGRLRGTNGNNSYGLYGSVSEGFNPAENFITALVDNQSQEAQVDIVHTTGSEIFAFAYSNAGLAYTTATNTVTGSGYDIDARFEEFRNTALYEIRSTDLDGNNIFGGLNYQYLLNSAQLGDDVSITLAAADTTGTNALYSGQRIFIASGAGIGQYGYITTYDDTTKVALISKDIDGTPGWESIYPGTPIVTALDSSTRYSLEPRVIVEEPQFLASTGTSPVSVSGMAYSNGQFVAISTAGNAAHSTDGVAWTSKNIGGSVTYVTGASDNFIAFTDSATSTIYRYAGTTWGSVDIGATATWVGATYDRVNNYLVAISSGTDSRISTNYGASWAGGGTLTQSGCVEIAANGRVIVAIKTGNTFTVSTNQGTTWTNVTVPISRTWNSITYGAGRFVVVGNTTDTIYSFNGTTWYQGTINLSARNWSKVRYAEGLFLAVNSVDGRIATSQCGKNWRLTTKTGTTKQFTVDQPYAVLAAGTISGVPTWIASGNSGTGLGIIKSGAIATVRAIVTSSRIQKFLIYEPGSGYVATPLITITDNGNTEDVTYIVRLGNGVLPQPAFYNNGLGYVRATATISGDGYADIFQNSGTLYVNNLSRLPGPGDNLEINTINDVVYKITSISDVSGTAPNFSGRIIITPTIDRKKSPAHAVNVTIRQSYSQVRLTGHDFLDIGTGNVLQTQYPELYLDGFTQINEPQPFNEVVEKGGGRVFYTSTDQDGNFRVGELFKVEQSTGVVSVNASYFNLSGLTELSLGGIQVGGSAVVIREFSKDQNFAANSNSIIPTQRAIIAYLTSRISSGGADAVTNTLIAGQVKINSNNITTTSGLPITVFPKVNITGGTDGKYLSAMYYAFGSMVGI